MKTIAERLKEGMELRGMKQADLARITGISKGSLSSYLSGRYAPKRDSLFKLAKALNVSDEWLMGADVPMQRHPSFTDPQQNDRTKASDLFPTEALGEDLKAKTSITVKRKSSVRKDGVQKYVEMLYKNPRYRLLLDSTAKLDEDALDNLVRFIKNITPEE